MENKKVIYTLGYTLFQKGTLIDIEGLFKTLKDLHVDYLIDVRSVPYSKHYPQCNAANMKIEGSHRGIPYANMPEIGAKASCNQDVFSKASDIFFDNIFPIAKSNRPEKTELYPDDYIVDFDKFRSDEYFVSGLKRIETAYDKGYTFALMCSEKNPVECHRFFLISTALEKKYGDWLEVRHIIYDESRDICTITNSKLKDQLKEIVTKKKEIRQLEIMQKDITQYAPIDNYFGATTDEKEQDFCMRYWNLMHGWKKMNILNNYEYD